MAALSDIIILDQLDSTNRWSDLYDDIDNSQTASGKLLYVRIIYNFYFDLTI